MNNVNTVRRLAGSDSIPPAAGQAEERTSFVRQYIRIAWRWRKTILAATIGCMLLGLVITLLMTPQYTASSTIEIAREGNSIINIQGVEREASESDQEFYQTQYGLLKSASLAERVAVQLKLVDDPAFFDMFKADKDDLLFQTVNGREVPLADKAKRQRVAGQILLDNLDVSPLRASRLIDLSFTSPDPALSARVANAWTKNFIEATLERRYQATSYARNFLEQRIEQLRRRLEQSERALVQYASDQRIINLNSTGQAEASSGGGERSVLVENLAALNAELQKATADRVQAEARFAQTRAGEATEALTNSAINTMRGQRAELSADYQKLLAQFEPAYPPARALQAQIAELDRSITREERRVGGALSGRYREAQQRESALQDRVESLQNDLLDLRRRSIQYNIYQREVDTNRLLYNGLLQRYKEIGIAGGVGVNNVSVVDGAAVPERPSSPRLVLNMVLALLAGLSLGGLLAFFFEQTDDSIDDANEVQRLIGLPLLGTVPKLIGRSPTDALLDRKSELVDAYIAVQTNLQFATENGVPRSISVTSTRPTEGKSTTAFSLAALLARSQRKVVLVDGDMRSPSVHHLIGAGHESGLSNYLAGSDNVEAMLIPVESFGFTAMTSGPIPPNAAELLTGSRLATLIETLLKHFDHVVIDSPPVLGLADAPLISSRVEATVYAVESHGIRAGLVRTALGRLQSANARIVGAVLTKFESKRSAGSYSYDYGYSYGRDEKTRSRPD